MMESILGEDSLELDGVWELLDPKAMIYLLVVMFVLWVARKIFDWLTPYDLAEQLTDKDNKAIAVSFAGYLLGVGAILLAVLGGSSDVGFDEQDFETPVEFFGGLGISVAWCLGGIALLHVARVANDRLILHKFSNVKELVEDRNIGTGAVECGSYVGSGLILHAAMSGDSSSLIESIVTTLIYFFVGQLMFIAFGAIFAKMVRYDVHAELEADNAAAGVSVGMSMTAMAVLLAGYIRHSSSLPGIAVWFLVCIVLLAATRYLVDKLILPGRLLDEEVSQDRNWGAALIEGSSAVLVAVVVNACFLG